MGIEEDKSFTPGVHNHSFSLLDTIDNKTKEISEPEQNLTKRIISING